MMRKKINSLQNTKYTHTHTEKMKPPKKYIKTLREASDYNRYMRARCCPFHLFAQRLFHYCFLYSIVCVCARQRYQHVETREKQCIQAINDHDDFEFYWYIILIRIWKYLFDNFLLFIQMVNKSNRPEFDHIHIEKQTDRWQHFLHTNCLFFFSSLTFFVWLITF